MKRSPSGFSAGFVATLLLFALVVTWVLVGMPTVARAVSCGNMGFTVQGADKQYGAKVGNVDVINPVSTCGLVRSMYVFQTDRDFVEVGWFEDGTDGSAEKCDNVTNPHILVYAKVDGFIKCKSNTPALLSSVSYSFRVDNPDHDLDFVYYWDSDNTPDISLGFFSVDIHKGWPLIGDERHGDTDSLLADFTGANALGTAGNWDPLDSPLTTNTILPVGNWFITSYSSTSLHVNH